MIASLNGVVQEKREDAVVVDVQGVGYLVNVSALTLVKLPRAGEPVKVRVRTVVREDALDLFGFQALEEEQLFDLLTSVSHIGPRMAIGILSGMEPAELAESIRTGNVGRLKAIKGVGKKTAERLVVELREKIELGHLEPALTPASTPARLPGVLGDLVSALVNLGYKPAQAERAAQAAQVKLGEDAGLEALIREALQAVR